MSTARRGPIAYDMLMSLNLNLSVKPDRLYNHSEELEAARIFAFVTIVEEDLEVEMTSLIIIFFFFGRRHS